MRWVLAGMIIAGLVGLLAGSAGAHKGKLPDDALTLVRQAAALLAQNPAMTGEVKERLEAALKSKRTDGVHMDQVADALRAMERKDVGEARKLLMASIMPAGMPMPPQGPRSSTPAPPASSTAPPAPSPERPAGPPPVDVAMKMAEPLRVRFAGSRTETIILAVSLALIGLGLTSLWRSREGAHP